MGIFYDELQFDDRAREDLFTGIKSHEPRYADIVKQWAAGSSLTDYEKKITASILIFYPEYILDNGKDEESIELLREYLLQPEFLQKPMNPEKGLFLYTLFLVHLKAGKKEESLELLEKLEVFFENPDSSIFHQSLENAYLKILSLILERREILSLKPGFSISQLPGLPFKKISVFEGTNCRGQALEFYYKKEYDKASAIYMEMLINKFETPGTLAHLARLELISGNIAQAEIFIVNAWRVRHEAPAYVLVRILFFILLINMVRNYQSDLWLGCLKHALNQPDSKMQWDMDRIICIYANKLRYQNLELLKALLEFMSGNGDDSELNKVVKWQKATPVSFVEWPDFSPCTFLVEKRVNNREMNELCNWVFRYP
jgi:tetratricopeptide (TPR) repeat protein